MAQLVSLRKMSVIDLLRPQSLDEGWRNLRDEAQRTIKRTLTVVDLHGCCLERPSSSRTDEFLLRSKILAQKQGGLGG